MIAEKASERSSGFVGDQRLRWQEAYQLDIGCRQKLLNLNQLITTCIGNLIACSGGRASCFTSIHATTS